MEIDIIWMTKWFATFNQTYFKNSLPNPHFRVGHARTQLGSMAYKSIMRWGKTQYTDFTITLSNHYDMNEYDYQNVLLHEMIHLYIAHHKLKDTGPHGRLFRSFMQQLNEVGWNISVSTHISDTATTPPNAHPNHKQYLILALQMKDGQYYLSSVNPKFARTLHKKISTIHDIADHRWFVSEDPWFANMPKVRSLRARKVSKALYQQKVQEMKPIRL